MSRMSSFTHEATTRIRVMCNIHTSHLSEIVWLWWKKHKQSWLTLHIQDVFFNIENSHWKRGSIGTALNRWLMWFSHLYYACFVYFILPSREIFRGCFASCCTIVLLLLKAVLTRKIALPRSILTLIDQQKIVLNSHVQGFTQLVHKAVQNNVVLSDLHFAVCSTVLSMKDEAIQDRTSCGRKGIIKLLNK